MASFPRGANGFARVNPRAPVAFAICDRCGQRYNHSDLVWQFDWAGTQLQNKRILVCVRKCLDEFQEQLRSYALPADPVPVLNPRPDLSNQTGSYKPYLVDGLGNYVTDAQNQLITVDP